MKKITLLLALVIFAAVQAPGQEYVRPSFEELEQKMREYNALAEAAFDAEMNGEAVRILTEFNDLLSYHMESDPEYWRDYLWDFDYVMGGNYYNIACCQALEGNREEALEAFEKAGDHGYNRFRWALEDSDLESLREEPRFLAVIEKMRLSGDYMAILQSCGPYVGEDTSPYPQFEYEPVTSGRLWGVRSYMGLDTVVSGKDEIAQIIALMTYVHDLIPHDGSYRAFCGNTAIDLYNYSKANGGRGVNCRQLAIVLNDCYLSMGFKSRFVTCLPRSEQDYDCHVICSVWSNDLGKWVWMDPSFNAWVTDENGTLLGIAEVRERMRDGRPYFLNEEANHNNTTPETKAGYLDDYMAKNLYWLQVPARSYIGVESPYHHSTTKYVGLVPPGYINSEYVGENIINTSDADYFWQAPEGAGEN
ncbi:MAG: transglutaminase domain-containing protein [Alistipes sp.]|nr:transglutaminase domain-containing protein [Alistipes sp.]